MRSAGVDAAFMRKFYDRVAPGVRAEFDGPAMLPLIAPRPLLVINGDSDPRTPVAGVRESVAAARAGIQGAGRAGAASAAPAARHRPSGDGRSRSGDAGVVRKVVGAGEISDSAPKSVYRRR